MLELPRGFTATQLAGGFGLVGEHALSGRIQESFLGRLEALPAETRLLLLVAAAEPVGDPLLVWGAAERLGIDASAAAAAATEGLLAIGERVTFRHPLVRSAVYRSASPQERSAVHQALAEVTDAQVDPDRRAWHPPQRQPDPEAVAVSWSGQRPGPGARGLARRRISAALARLAGVGARGPTARWPPRRPACRRARSMRRSGCWPQPRRVTGRLQNARAELLRGQIAFASSVGSDAPPLLLKAAQRLERLDPKLARETYLDAWGAALFAGRLALLEVSRAARSAPPPAHPPRPSDLLLDGLATLITDGHIAAAPC